MPRLIDAVLDESGEIAIASNGDIALCGDADVVLQELRFRMLTVKGDWSIEPNCGASLETLVGEAMDSDTLRRAESLTSEALLNDGFFSGYLSSLQAIPISRQELALVVDLESLLISATETFTLNLQEGELD